MKTLITAALLAASPLLCAPALAEEVTTTSAPQAASLFEGKRLTVLVEGPEDGQDVVLIPGLASPRAVWGPTAERLKGKYRLHIVQIRGFGDEAGMNGEEGPVLDAFITELGDYIDDQIDNKRRPAPAVIGHSMGGLSALMLGAYIPGKIGKIMVVDAVPFIGTIFGSPNVDAIRPQAEAMAAGMRATYGKPTGQAPVLTDEQKEAAARSNRMSNNADGQEQVARWSSDADPRVTAQLMYDVMTTDMRPKLPNIVAPVTLLYAHDPAIMTEAQATGAFVPQYAGAARFNAVRIEGSRHFIMLDQPQKFAEEVDAFLAR